MRRTLKELSKCRLDVIVIGGGIVGAGIAREARLRGLSVALFEKGDFASGTSGRTSSLIHGGIRYLEQGAFRLVYEAVQERFILSRLAPHLVRPLPFLFPIYQGRGRDLFTVRVGMILYNFLAGSQSVGQYMFLSPERVRQLEPALSQNGLLGAARFMDCQMDDARLCLATLLSAQARGAEIFNYTPVISLIQKEQKICGVKVKEAHTGNEYEISASVVINATGAWPPPGREEREATPTGEGQGQDNTIAPTDDMMSKDRVIPAMPAGGVPPAVGVPTAGGVPPVGAGVRPTKGVHIVMPKITERHAVVLESPGSRRIFFVMPWREQTLIGTTDTDYQGDPDHVIPNQEEIESLLKETAPFFPAIANEKVLASFAGLRPLVNQGKKNSWDVSRKEKIEWTPDGLLMIMGGKYTLFRKIAIKVIQAVMKKHPQMRTLRRPHPEPPIYGGEMNGVDEYMRQQITSKDIPINPRLLSHLIDVYGTHYEAVLACADDDNDLTPLTPLGYPVLAEVIYAARNEYARHLCDFMFRRTRLAHGPFQRSVPLIQAIAEKMGAELGWNKETIQEECAAYLQEIP
jgi:glycerol-3-phosphate dehydrogenase